ncbi:MAG TPA: MFS transporter, partial [Reyranella sp.]|nr:MFS transporter [Reyranella sp.]
VQMILPNFMRARGMAVNQMVFFGAMVAGSLLWGKIAGVWGVRPALIVSAISLVPLTLLAASIRLPGTSSPRL